MPHKAERSKKATRTGAKEISAKALSAKGLGTKSPSAKGRSADAKPAARRTPPAVDDLGLLNGHLGYYVRRLQIWVFQDFIRKLAPLEISPAQFSVLAVIQANEGLSQAELGNTLAIERARLVRLLNRLQRRGLLERLPSSADGRRHALRLTPTGQTMLKQAKSLVDQHEAGLLAKLGEARYQALMNALRG